METGEEVLGRVQPKRQMQKSWLPAEAGAWRSLSTGDHRSTNAHVRESDGAD